jgi:hypothetical protein
VSLTVAPPPGELSVSPSTNLVSSGTEGGPFSPASITYTLTNVGGQPIDWTATKTQDWVSLSSGGGTLASDASVNMVVSINAIADNLDAGCYSCTVSFVNTTNGEGSTTRDVSLTVTPDGSDPLPMTTASRTSGVAPLSVFFDAVDTDLPLWASGVLQPADGDHASFDYRWDFGDPGSGDWGTGRQNADGTYPSKNQATGYLAAHVYEAPGSYTVTLSITDTDDDVHYYFEDIEVLSEPPGGWTTYYVSSSEGDDGHDGLSEDTPLETFGAAMARAVTNTRILFKRGDTFVTGSDGEGQILADGPGSIGAYGVGAKPIILRTHSGITLWGAHRPDWRFLDLEFRTEFPDTPAGNAIAVQGPGSLMLRCDAVLGFERAFTVDHDDLVFQETVSDGSGCGWWASPDHVRLALLGCSLINGTGDYALYSRTAKVLVGHCHASAGGDFGTLRFRGTTAPEMPARHVVVSDNFFGEASTTPGGYGVRFGPANPDVDQVVAHVVVERNVWHQELSRSAFAMFSSGADHVTIRNNKISGPETAVRLDSVAPDISTWTDWRIYGNTVVRLGAGGAFFSALQPFHSVEIRNNVLAMPDPLTCHVIRMYDLDECAAFVCDTNNWYVPCVAEPFLVNSVPYTLAEWQGLGHDLLSLMSDPNFADVAENDLRLQPGSPAIDAGADLRPWVRDDHDRSPRPLDGDGDSQAVADMGAFEYQP